MKKPTNKLNPTAARKQIIDYVGQFIKKKHEAEGDALTNEGYDLMIGNLKEFIEYLEERKIINQTCFEN